jgi:polar amino acid transport system permease protein
MPQDLWFGWFRADIIAEYAPLFWRGLQMTILVTVICIVQGTLLGLAIGMARLAEARHAPARQICRFALRWPATVYVSFFRGTPLFVQILLIHFAVMPLFINPVDGLLISGETARNIKQNYGAFLSGVVALTLNAGAYISEVFRAGIQSIDRGQHEAAETLGLGFVDKMRFIILPQAVRRVLPPLGNQFVYMLKTSSLVSVIGLAELTRKANELVVTEYRPLEIYTALIVEYLVLILAVSWVMRALERKMAASDYKPA